MQFTRVIFIQFALKFVHKGPIDNESACVEATEWSGWRQTITRTNVHWLVYPFPCLSVPSMILWKVQHFAANKFWVENYILRLPNYIPGHKWYSLPNLGKDKRNVRTGVKISLKTGIWFHKQHTYLSNAVGEMTKTYDFTGNPRKCTYPQQYDQSPISEIPGIHM